MLGWTATTVLRDRGDRFVAGALVSAFVTLFALNVGGSGRHRRADERSLARRALGRRLTREPSLDIGASRHAVGGAVAIGSAVGRPPTSNGTALPRTTSSNAAEQREHCSIGGDRNRGRGAITRRPRLALLEPRRRCRACGDRRTRRRATGHCRRRTARRPLHRRRFSGSCRISARRRSPSAAAARSPAAARPSTARSRAPARPGWRPALSSAWRP